MVKNCKDYPIINPKSLFIFQSLTNFPKTITIIKRKYFILDYYYYYYYFLNQFKALKYFIANSIFFIINITITIINYYYYYFSKLMIQEC